jgi:hypothetical protein
LDCEKVSYLQAICANSLQMSQKFSTSPLANSFEGVIGFWQFSDKFAAGCQGIGNPLTNSSKVIGIALKTAHIFRGLPTPSDRLSNGY